MEAFEHENPLLAETTVYPEHEKRSGILEKSQAIGEFLDWIGEQGYRLQKWVVQDEDGPCPGTIWHECDGGREMRVPVDGGEPYTTANRCQKCNGTGTYIAHFEGEVGLQRSIESVLAEFFGIDLKVIEQERRAMIESMREANSQ